MTEPALRFVNEPYDPETVAGLLAEFREKGFVVLPDLFERETVLPFVSQLEELMVHDGIAYRIPDEAPHFMHGGCAPRIRQVLPGALSPSIQKPPPSFSMTVWIIETADARGDIPEWHKDRMPDGMPGTDYHYPLDVFVGLYFEDTTPEHGPTRVIPGSHRDMSLLPDTEAPVEDVFCRKQDGLLIDQRTWHAGSRRTVPGTRFLAVYGYYAVPIFYSFVFPMPRSQRDAWDRATTRDDRIFFGGPHARPVDEQR